MISLGIESTAHTFGCSVVEVSLDNRKSGTILSDVREVYKGLAGSGIHPREASRHHCNVCSEVLKKSLQQAKTTLKEVDVIAYSAGPGLGPCLRIGAVAKSYAAILRKTTGSGSSCDRSYRIRGYVDRRL